MLKRRNFLARIASGINVQRRILKLSIYILVGVAAARCQTVEHTVSAPQPRTNAAPTLNQSVSDGLPDARQIMQRAVAKDVVNWQAAKDYTFLQRTQEDVLDGDGATKSSKSETSEILVLYGEPFERVIAKRRQAAERERAAKAEREIWERDKKAPERESGRTAKETAKV